ncbi:MAG: hypothetical protein Q4B63_10470 [Clostridium perfringens]|nr:hypothetical protein [Clostridium perfringens]
MKRMKLSKEVKLLGKTIGLDNIISSLIFLILIIGVIISLNKGNIKGVTWEYMLKSSKDKYVYEEYDKDKISKLNESVQEFYKLARVLYGYSDVDHCLLEKEIINGDSTYGWDSNYSKKLKETMEAIVSETENIKNIKTYTIKEKKKIVEALKMIRYFCDNQQIINKARMKMKLISNYSDSTSISILLIDDGGAEYLVNYEDDLTKVKGIINSR